MSKVDIIGTLDETTLYEIQDKSLIDRISDIIPDADKYLSESQKNKDDIFKALIPLDLSPETAREISGVISGLIEDPDVIKKYADRFKTDVRKILNPSVYFSGISIFYNVASMVAQEITFHEINQKLGSMGEEINQISAFQEAEFKSKIITSYQSVSELSEFTSEIISKDEMRKRNLIQLDGLKSNVNQLLNQVNESIKRSIGKPDIEFSEYKKSIDHNAMMIKYQDVLTKILEEISNLIYTFNNGNITTELSFSTYNNAIETANSTRDEMSQWHEKYVKEFGIDLQNKKVTKKGIEGIISAIPGVINKDFTKKQLSDEFVQSILDQSKTNVYIAENPRVLSDPEITLLIHNGKYYYMASKVD